MENPVIIAAEKLSKELESRGLKSNFAVSDTDYGTSCYFVFCQNEDSLDSYKIRISDHSVQNSYRMQNESCYSTDLNVENVATGIECYLYPERFQFIPVVKGQKPTHRRNGQFCIMVRK